VAREGAGSKSSIVCMALRRNSIGLSMPGTGVAPPPVPFTTMVP